MKKFILKIIYYILALFSKIYLFRNKVYVLGITGSVGKTSCRMIIFQVLEKFLKSKRIYTSPKNFNSELGLIFSVFEIEKYEPGIKSLVKILFKIFFKSLFSKPNYEVLILEYGIDKPFDMDFLLKIAKPNIAIFTKLDAIHLMNFSSLDEIGKEKFKLLKMAKNRVYLNYLDEYCRKHFDEIKVEKSYYFGQDLVVKNYEFEKNSENKIYAKFSYLDFFIKTNLLGEENANYTILAFDILKNIDDNFILEFLSLSDEEVYKDMNEDFVDNHIFLDLEIQNGRFSIFSGVGNSILVDSSYNSGPESMKIMINNIFLLKEKIFTDYKIGFVLGDMRELGEKTEEEHKKLGNLVKNADFVFTVGESMKNYFTFDGNYKNYLSSQILGIYLKEFLLKSQDKYLILFKGSQNTIFVEESLKEVLLNNEDKLNLVRQENYWLDKKGLFLTK